MSGYCLVANQAGRSIAVVSLARFRVMRQIPLVAAPEIILAHPSRPRVFVLTPENGTVSEIDAATYTVGRRVRGGNQTAGMRLSPDGDALWVLYRDPPSLVEIPLDTMKVGRRIRLASTPDAFDLVKHSDRSVSLAAIASRQGRTVTLASLKDAAIERTISTADEPSMVCCQSDGRQVIAASWRDKSATIYEWATGKTVVCLPLPLSPRQFCVSWDRGQVFVTGDGMDAVVVIYPYQTEISQTILAGRAPGAMAATGGDGRPSYLFVANPDTGDITVLDYETYSLVAVVEVGRGPGQILITPDGQYALVLNSKSGDMAVVRLLALATAPNGARRKFKSAPIFTMIPVGDGPVSAALIG